MCRCYPTVIDFAEGQLHYSRSRGRGEPDVARAYEFLVSADRVTAVGWYLSFLIIGIFIGAIAGGILAIDASSSHAKMLGFHDWNELSA